MAPLNIALLIVLLASFGLLLSRPVRRSTAWSAMVTPLASIVGSG